jgi:hypothetical protein
VALADQRLAHDLRMLALVVHNEDLRLFDFRLSHEMGTILGGHAGTLKKHLLITEI